MGALQIPICLCGRFFKQNIYAFTHYELGGAVSNFDRSAFFYTIVRA